MKEDIKLILKSVRQYKKYSIITPIFMMIEAILECFIPFIMSILIDTIAHLGETINGVKCDMTTFIPYPYNAADPTVKPIMYVSIIWIIVVLIVIAMITMTCGILGGRYAAKASVGMSVNLRNDLYKKIQSFSFANIDKFSTSSLITRLTTDINYVQMSFQMCIRIVIRAPLMLIFSSIMAFISGGTMAFIFIVLIPVIAFGLYLICSRAMKIFIRVFKRYDKLNESVQENVSGIRVVKAYVREEFEKNKFNTASNDMTKDFTKAEKIVALNNPLMNTAIHLSNILVLGIGSGIIFNNANYDPLNKIISYKSLTPGQMSSLLTYGIQILSSLMFISMILVMLIMSFESIKRIGEVLKEQPTIVNPENPIMEVPNGDIDFNNVNFKYASTAEKNTLNNIDIHIKSGQFIGILGSTGSGKTSLINLISRLYDVSEGQVVVAGHDVREYDLKTLRDNVSVVLQKNVLFSGTVASNLRWGNENATEEEMWNALKIAQAYDVVQAYPEKLDRKVEQGGANFSGGQKQRLCIARAIMKNPKVIILDDSTSAVDTKTDKLIRKGLKEDLPHITKIVIAQRISSIEDADQIIILDDGNINAIGTHEQLLANNHIYQEVYSTQNRVGGEE